MSYSDYLNTHYSACGMEDYHADKKEQEMEEKIENYADYILECTTDGGYEEIKYLIRKLLHTKYKEEILSNIESLCNE